MRESGNIIAETNGGGPTGSTGTLREYIYLPEAEIAPTFGSRTSVDRPIGVVEGVNTASPVLWFVHVDHLNRPVKMTDTAKAAVWDAVFLPWGGVHAITGSATLDARFPGQWFQLESGLHYNWHRQYDPSIGRYIQADPLGFVDGPSVYGYARGMPQAQIDPDGRILPAIVIGGAALGIAGDLAFQFGKNMISTKGDFEKSFICINLSTLPYSAAIGGVSGGFLATARAAAQHGLGSFGARTLAKATALWTAGKYVSPPITIADILNPSGANNLHGDCGCKK